MVSDKSSKTPKDFDEFTVEVQKVDGVVVNIPSDNSYIDIRIPEANCGLIRYVKKPANLSYSLEKF